MVYFIVIIRIYAKTCILLNNNKTSAYVNECINKLIKQRSMYITHCTMLHLENIFTNTMQCINIIRNDVGAEWQHDMRPFVLLPSTPGADSKLALTMVHIPLLEHVLQYMQQFLTSGDLDF